MSDTLLYGEHLYFMRSEFYHFKIGRAKDPAERLKEIQRRHFVPLHLVAVFEGRGCDEADWHKNYSDVSLRREWFDRRAYPWMLMDLKLNRDKETMRKLRGGWLPGGRSNMTVYHENDVRGLYEEWRDDPQHGQEHTRTCLDGGFASRLFSSASTDLAAAYKYDLLSDSVSAAFDPFRQASLA